MDTRRITFIATIAVIAALAVGTGYAYVAYTTNGGNETDVAYVTVTQEDGQGNSKYTFTDVNTTIMFSTFNQNTAEEVYFKLDSANSATLEKTGFPSFQIVDLGNVNLVANYVGPEGQAPSALYVTVSNSANFKANDTWMYFLISDYSINAGKITDAKVYAYKNNESDGAWSAGPDSLVLNIESTGNTYKKEGLHLCYGYPAVTANKNFDPTDPDLRGFVRTSVKPTSLQSASVILKATEVAPVQTPSYVVTYNSNAGDGSIEYVALMKEGTDYTLVGNDKTLFDAPAGKEFKSWNSKADGTGDTITTIENISSDTTVYAVWGNITE